jgi:hypothetical protein
MTIADWPVILLFGFVARIGWELADLTWECLCAVFNVAIRIMTGVRADQR